MLEYVGLAFLGGIVLNVMPCVLPVVSLKIFHTLTALTGEAHDAKKHGLAYAAGTVFAFILFALVVVGLRASGKSLGWGMHFRHPGFVAALVATIFAFGLNALGIFEIAFSLAGDGRHRGGLSGSFANGIFAAVMSTPCTAPFLVTAAGFALAAGTHDWQTLAIFAVIGLGLAFPYVIVGYFPAVARVLPRPGPWMVTFKQVMGFTLLGTAVWLFGALQRQVTPASANAFLMFLVALGIGLWAIGRFATPDKSSRRRAAVRALVLGGLVATWLLHVDLRTSAARPHRAASSHEEVIVAGKIHWTPFDPQRIKAAHARLRPVFVDYTADWCVACQTNERLFLDTEAVRGALAESNILPMKADMTNPDQVMDTWLAALNRTGIPAYAIYLPNGEIDLLPIAITADIVSQALAKAGKAFPPRSQVGVAPCPDG